MSRTIYLQCQIYQDIMLWNNTGTCKNCSSEILEQVVESIEEIDISTQSQYQQAIMIELQFQNQEKSNERRRAVPIENKGWITQQKDCNNLQIFYVNPNSFGPDKIEKIESLKK